ncbi:hypothetical protein H920_04657 [Fukomys damarensis]|uniref:Uncharacterized protein n=1 Tax=Fukomys damarensis TaxID=885580 RepID=A0A091DP64_FUKDA|nr:hypothetical protein H920_04657 [Fukomys damarensis]
MWPEVYPDIMDKCEQAQPEACPDIIRIGAVPCSIQTSHNLYHIQKLMHTLELIHSDLWKHGIHIFKVDRAAVSPSSFDTSLELQVKVIRGFIACVVIELCTPDNWHSDEQGAARSPELGDVKLGGVARSVRMRKCTSLGKVRICALARVDGRKNRALSGAVKEEDVFPDCLLLVFETQD